MRKRAGALFIQDGKLFLISEGGQGFYWTPGGGLEVSESFEEALERELAEELGAKLHSASLYLTFNDTEADELVRYFLVDIAYPKELPNGTKLLWYTRADHAANKIPISKRIYSLVYPKLMADGLV